MEDRIRKESRQKVGAALVVGGGIGGMEAALNLADSGIKVYLLDNKSSIGGVMAQLDKTFPTNDCAMCSMAPRLVEIGRHRDIEVITLADIEKIEGNPGNFTVTLKKRPRYVNQDKCTGCGSCVSNCPVKYEIYQISGLSEIKLEHKDLTQVLEIVNRYKDKKQNLIAILQDIDKEYRYLPDFLLKFISREFDIPLSQIYSIATFYKAFSLVPKGKYKINVCLGTACHVRGAANIMESLQRDLHIRAGETSKDMLFSLEAVRCVGCCGLAPVVTINDELYGKATMVKMSRIIEKITVEEKNYAKT